MSGTGVVRAHIRSRGRVIKALVSTVAIVVIAACSSSGDGLEDELQAISEELGNSYLRPLMAADREAGGSLCGFTRISGSPGKCIDLVETIAEISPVLENLLARLESLRAQLRPDEIVIMDNLLVALQALRNSDQVLIDGWLLGDDDLWQEGWELRKEAGAKMAVFLEAAIEYIESHDD